MATKTQFVALNGSAGALVAISVSMWTKRMEIIEDGLVGTPQGLQGTSYEDGFVQNKIYDPSEEPIIFQNQTGTGNRDTTLGVPAQKDAQGNTTVATVICKLKSATATTTKVRVTEYDR